MPFSLKVGCCSLRFVLRGNQSLKDKRRIVRKIKDRLKNKFNISVAEIGDQDMKNNLYLGNAPDTFLGGGGQLSRKIIDNNDIGQILTGNFIFAFPGVQDFHPNPESWFQEGGGPVIDMGPYFFTTLVNLLGPAKSVTGRGMKFFENREYKAGPKKGKPQIGEVQ